MHMFIVCDYRKWDSQNKAVLLILDWVTGWLEMFFFYWEYDLFGFGSRHVLHYTNMRWLIYGRIFDMNQLL